MISPPVIHNFNKLVEPYLEGGRVISHKTRFLTKPCDNYGSTMLAVTANVQKPNGQIEELELVAKLPPMSEAYWKMFRPQKTFVTENNMYTEVACALRQFVEDQNLNDNAISDVFPKCYGARVSLDEKSKQVDRDATLLLENLATSGYRTGERTQGFDYETTLVILKHLATFHALPIALKILKPKVFKEKLLDSVQPFYMNDYIEQEVKDTLFKANCDDMRAIPEIGEASIDKIPELYGNFEKYMRGIKRDGSGLFDTLAHNDFWVNNMLIQNDSEGKPSKIKIVDFQLVQPDSLMHDVVFFLFTSVKFDMLTEKFDEFLEIYYNYFIEVLETAQCPTSDYTFEKFLDEFKRIAPIQVSHVMMMLKVVFLNKEAAPEDFNDVTPDLFSKENAYGNQYFNKLKQVVLMYQKLGIM